MKRKINFTDNEEFEFMSVMKICQPDIGFTSAGIGRLISVYFNKNYTAELVYKECFGNSLSSNVDSFVIISKTHRISFKHIIEELVDRGLIIEDKIVCQDINGDDIYCDMDNGKKIKRKRTVYKVK